MKLREPDFRPTLVLNRNVTIAASNDTEPDIMPTVDFDYGVNMFLVSLSEAHLAL